MADTTKKGSREFKRNFFALLSQQDRTNLITTTGTFETTVNKNVSSPIRIQREENLVTVSKFTGTEPHTTNDTVDFYFKFRIFPSAGDIELWPIYFQDKGGRVLQAEITLCGKVMTNTYLQNELIDLANTWGKSLGSQVLTRSIEGLI